MTNIISNSCIGSYITTLCLNQHHINPFCWNIIDSTSFKNLIENYNTINFKNIELSFHEKIHKYTVTIDNLVSILYEHYIKDDNYKTTVKKNCNVYSRDIDKYITEKYFSRLKMGDIPPIFIAGSSWPNGSYSFEEYKNLIESNKNNFKLIIIVNNLDDYNKLKEYENNNTKIYLTDLLKNNKLLSNKIFSNYKNFILENFG